MKVDLTLNEVAMIQTLIVLRKRQLKEAKSRKGVKSTIIQNHIKKLETIQRKLNHRNHYD